MQSPVRFRSNDDLTSDEEEEEEDGTFAGTSDCIGDKAMTYRNRGTDKHGDCDLQERCVLCSHSITYIVHTEV